MATHSSILAWRIPWTEEPAGLQSMRLQTNTTEHSTSAEIGTGPLARTLRRCSPQLAYCPSGNDSRIIHNTCNNDNTPWIYRDFPVNTEHSPSLSPEMTSLESTQGNSLPARRLKEHFEEYTESPQIPWPRALSEALLNIQISGPQTDLLITNISGKVLGICVYANSPKWILSPDKARKYCSGKIFIIFNGSVPAVLGGPGDQSAGHLFIFCQWFVNSRV